MARYIGSVCRLCRREGSKLFLKSDRCNSYKCSIEKRAFAPGQHGMARKFKLSEYCLQLREKQKAKRLYGILENQFKRYFKAAEKILGKTGDNLLMLIERRIDNVLVKAKLFKPRQMARQFINHGHFLLNGKKINIPSYLVKENDVISMINKSKDILFIKNIQEELKKQNIVIPSWLSFDIDKLEIKVLRLPNIEDIQSQINEQSIVELYSK